MDNKSFEFVLSKEGGISNHPSDAGGVTNMGVTQKTYDSYSDKKGLPRRDVRGMSKNEASDIYESMFWSPSGCNSLQLPLALAVFDTAVNFGVFRAVSFLQKVSGAKTDGVLGPKTILAAQSKDSKELAVKIVELRIARRHETVAKNPSQKVFLKGWINRDEDLRQEILRFE